MKYTLLKNKITGERSIRVTGGEKIVEKDNPTEYARLRKLALKNRDRADRDDVMRSMGLTKVYGAVSGQTYWE